VGGTYQVTDLAGPSTAPVVLSIASSSSLVCSIGGSGLVSFNAVGSCEIDADQAADTNWTAAHASQTLTVGQGTGSLQITSIARSSRSWAAPTRSPTCRSLHRAGRPQHRQLVELVCSIGGSGLVSFNAVGSCEIDADQAADTNWTAAHASQTLTVGQGTVATTTKLSSNHNPSVYNQSVTFTATVARTSGTGTPTGTVQFKDGATVLGTGSLSGGVAKLTTSSLSVALTQSAPSTSAT